MDWTDVRMKLRQVSKHHAGLHTPHSFKIVEFREFFRVYFLGVFGAHTNNTLLYSDILKKNITGEVYKGMQRVQLEIHSCFSPSEISTKNQPLNRDQELLRERMRIRNDRDMVAYVQDGDLFIKLISSSIEVRLTYLRRRTKNATSDLKIIEFVRKGDAIVDLVELSLIRPIMQLFPDAEYLLDAGWLPDGKRIYVVLMNRLQTIKRTYLIPIKSFSYYNKDNVNNSKFPKMFKEKDLGGSSYAEGDIRAYLLLEETSHNGLWLHAHKLLRFLKPDLKSPPSSKLLSTFQKSQRSTVPTPARTPRASTVNNNNYNDRDGAGNRKPNSIIVVTEENDHDDNDDHDFDFNANDVTDDDDGKIASDHFFDCDNGYAIMLDTDDDDDNDDDNNNRCNDNDDDDDTSNNNDYKNASEANPNMSVDTDNNNTSANNKGKLCNIVSFICGVESSGYLHLRHVIVDLKECSHAAPSFAGNNQQKPLMIHEPKVLQNKKLTSGEWEVDGKNLWIDQVNKIIYFIGYKDTPLEAHLYLMTYETNSDENLMQPVRITKAGYSNSVIMDDKCKLFITTLSSLKVPNICEVYSISIGSSKVSQGLSKVKFVYAGSLHIPDIQQPISDPPIPFDFTSSTGTKLYGMVIKPPSSSSPPPPTLPPSSLYSSRVETMTPSSPAGSSKYPVVLYVYGGPHAQLVSNVFSAYRFTLQNKLSQFGYAVVIIDNRGSAHRGYIFEGHLKNKLGNIEISDQVEGLHYAAQTFDFLDLERVAIMGWSYGGYLALMGLVQRPDIFKVAISGAPVTSWLLYDTGYTERYLGMPKDNEHVYKSTSVVERANQFPTQEGRLFKSTRLNG
ncbi:hypothetical protein HELRODRAFT_194672 [Helobdella robusta]|uniref:Peptidase S9 prolyl oligopeptidase catalytic domain-containing protein n=1 Tax=Helobdella robusta TaxID=6412 RepID=T1FWA8_HELRO|nr:hypothetical protein HELRODRAFT_194672 [Helobdella robusta]ESN90169.1 hypothetical protein HELRODRAFT_194672 [Helobdella robusta]